LNNPDNGFYGIALSTNPGKVFTQQTFEHFALANGLQLTDDDGNANLNTPAMVETLNFYADLVVNYGPPGVQDLESTRTAYLAGQAAMIVWSPFILGDMAGLHTEALPTCPECADNPAFLLENSAFVPAIVGPSGTDPVQYGQISSMGITITAKPEAIEFVEFWLSEGYLDWLATSPEGKYPLLQGTHDNPTEFVEGWQQLAIGEEKTALSEFYGDEMVSLLAQGASNFGRWGFNHNQRDLVGAVYQKLPIPTYLDQVINGSLTADEAAEQIQIEVAAMQESLTE
jgi:multiple sugar transport system substrate-binding protein